MRSQGVLAYMLVASALMSLSHNRGVHAVKPPPIFILGVAKCGTTALYKLLAQHPQVKPARTFSGELAYRVGGACCVCQ